jgi:hypothetical protein
MVICPFHSLSAWLSSLYLFFPKSARARRQFIAVSPYFFFLRAVDEPEKAL